MSSTTSTSQVSRLSGDAADAYAAVLTPGALDFVAGLQRTFSHERRGLLARRRARQSLFDAGATPAFLPETEDVRKSDWTVAPIPPDLMDRRVEITGPAGDAKMMINALNSGASTYMADFEDSQSPTWRETVMGQWNLMRAVRGDIRHVTHEGKIYELNDRVATLIVRPRGLHLVEKHFGVHGEPVAASFFDFGLYLYHNADALLKKGSGPYFYIPKVESHQEARLWEGVCSWAETHLGLRKGTIKVTVLIETLTSAFEMDEILHELRGRAVGLNCGRWDYMFSYIKKLRNHRGFLLPDRAELSMDRGFLAAYVDLLIKTCHRRGAYAIGGMSAYIPVRSDPEANEKALKKVKEDKEREVRLGHDGTWVAHPGLVGVAREAFDSGMPGVNQLEVRREEVIGSKEDLLRIPPGNVTLEGVRTNVAVGLKYLQSWLLGKGCVPINGLMEDAATSEICRAQLWQWVAHGARTREGTIVTSGLMKEMIQEETARLTEASSSAEAIAAAGLAGHLFLTMVTGDHFIEFLTLPAYELLVAREERLR